MRIAARYHDRANGCGTAFEVIERRAGKGAGGCARKRMRSAEDREGMRVANCDVA